MKLSVIILAGGEAGFGTPELGPRTPKALLPVAGKPLCAYLAQAVAEASFSGPVIFAGPEEARAYLPSSFLLEPARDTFHENLCAAAERLRAEGGSAVGGNPTLLLGVDIPLLTAETLSRFVQKAQETRADLVYPVVEKSLCLARYPEARRTFVRLREGSFTGGNALYLRPGTLNRVIHLAERLHALRKSPLRLALFLGPGILLRYLTGTLTLSAVERRAKRITGLSCASLPFPHPEIAMDLDKPQDLAVIETALTRRYSSSPPPPGSSPASPQ
jgi:molybdopterin-guanine dinucleotide biosynthesis protein A